MAIQLMAGNGEQLKSAVVVEDEPIKLLGIKRGELPEGLIGFDIETGLATVQLKPDSEAIKVKIGKYLKKLGKSDEEVHLIGNKANLLKQMYKMPLKFTSTPEEVVDVYKRGPKSCMKGCDSVEVYATDDVAVAYLEFEDTVVARSVVCKNKTIGLQYIRAYGLIDVLEAKLKEARYFRGSLRGCKLRRVDAEKGYVMPYLDGNCTGVSDYGDFMIVEDGGEYDATRTSGLVGAMLCSACGELCDVEDVMLSCGDDAEELCDYCFEESHVWVDCNYYHRESSLIQETEDDGYMLVDETCYVEERSEHHPKESCVYNTHTDEYHLRTDLEI